MYIKYYDHGMMADQVFKKKKKYLELQCGKTDNVSLETVYQIGSS